MNKSLFIIPFLLLSNLILSQQSDKFIELFKKNREICFMINNISKKDLIDISAVISIDNVKNDTVIAYANKKEFDGFLKTGYNYTLLPNPNKNFNPSMLTLEELKGQKSWDAYPTYEAYISIMEQFQTDFPDICQVYSLGTSVEGRELLVAKITDNVNIDENEPEFLYTSTMHGNELVGYILMLRLIDSLLTSYGTDPRITNLVNNIEIYINPNANPDGTYAGGNNTVWGATRYNGNSVDLNRNYPDPENGPHPDGNSWQPETVAFMTFAENHHFVMSSNLHSGAEVCNYPWDTWSQYPADSAWWEYVCTEYSDTAQTYSPLGYMTYYGGVTNGYAWYSINGGRQDYMNYFHQCREFTLELSNTKFLPESDLPLYWNYNKRSLLNYLEQVLYGFSGIITDKITGQPIVAEVFILNYEADSSWVYSDLPIGNYHRPVSAGVYDVVYSAPGYLSDTVFGISVANRDTTLVNVQLVPEGLNISTKVLLEGPFNGNNMNTDLNAVNLIPLSQPFNSSPWDYSGTESVSSIPNDNIVDWVLIELRDASDSSDATTGTIIAKQAAFLLNNGQIISTDTAQILRFDGTLSQQLFIVIRHRNHLDIMSANAATYSNGIFYYDFTINNEQAYGTDAQKEITEGVWGMYCGDINGDGTIDNNDKSVNWQAEAGLSGYLTSDLNIDGESNNIDKDEFWLINQTTDCQIPE